MADGTSLTNITADGTSLTEVVAEGKSRKCLRTHRLQTPGMEYLPGLRGCRAWYVRERGRLQAAQKCSIIEGIV
jgi:hypothetical protein